MNRQRFNILLEDPSKVDNNDIRQLNEYRKKYPYFQSLYVVVAKALKDREHPKTDAFIKKAAIFSANRAHLKEIIESENFFIKPPLAEESITDQPKTSDIAQPIIVKSENDISSHIEGETQKTLDEKLAYNPNLKTLEDTKSRIEALLRGDVPAEDPEQHNKELEEIQDKIDSKLAKEAPKTVKKTKKNSQIEIIEKFIADDPRMDIQNRVTSESDQLQTDLAEKSLKEADTFITETMAKLMVKQGKAKRAIDIYQKLSLKFPDKSAYFASQIEKVKSKHNV